MMKMVALIRHLLLRKSGLYFCTPLCQVGCKQVVIDDDGGCWWNSGWNGGLVENSVGSCFSPHSKYNRDHVGALHGGSELACPSF